MLKWITAAVAAVTLLGLSAGCGVTNKQVTSVYWHNETTMFVAYVEAAGLGQKARVKRCLLAPDNSLSCADQSELDKVLNPR